MPLIEVRHASACDGRSVAWKEVIDLSTFSESTQPEMANVSKNISHSHYGKAWPVCKALDITRKP